MRPGTHSDIFEKVMRTKKNPPEAENALSGGFA